MAGEPVMAKVEPVLMMRPNLRAFIPGTTACAAKNAPILVLDEATSALDSEVEAAIQASLDTLMAGKTVIAIAHRLSTIARMDRPIVLERGRIVEQGTHDELLRHGGHYAALWRRQSGGFIDAGDMQAAE